MRLLAHVAQMLRETFAFGLASRRWALVVVIVVGLVVIGVAVAAQFVVPLGVYPFV